MTPAISADNASSAIYSATSSRMTESAGTTTSATLPSPPLGALRPAAIVPRISLSRRMVLHSQVLPHVAGLLLLLLLVVLVLRRAWRRACASSDAGVQNTARMLASLSSRSGSTAWRMCMCTCACTLRWHSVAAYTRVMIGSDHDEDMQDIMRDMPLVLRAKQVGSAAWPDRRSPDI